MFFINNSFPTIGQTFRAKTTGFIKSLRIKSPNFNSKSEVQLNFWVGPNPGRGKIFIDRPNQVIQLSLSKGTNENLIILPLINPFLVFKGKEYRVQFGLTEKDKNNNFTFKGSIMNSIPDGALFFHDGYSKKNRDLFLEIDIDPIKVERS